MITGLIVVVVEVDDTELILEEVDVEDAVD